MEFSNQKLSNQQLAQEYHWHCYRQLELIPDTVRTVSKSPGFTFGLDWVWRGFISLLADELVDKEQQVEYLERCRSLNAWGESEQSPSSSLRRLWLLMN